MPQNRGAKRDRNPGIWERWLRIKPLDAILGDTEKPEYQLKRALGPTQITLMGIGAIIGAGIFATIGTAAAGNPLRPGSGPALMVSFALTAIVCGFSALCYAEFASMVPISGSAYTYSYATLGEGLAWIIGWDLIIEYAMGNIGVAVSWANYFKDLLAGFHIFVPEWLAMDYRSAAAKEGVLESAPHLFGYPIVFNVLAIGIVAAITIVLVWGVRESARFNAVMVTVKIVVLLFFVCMGAFWVAPDNWHPFAPNGWSGISAAAAVIFFAYIGFDAVSTVAEETKDPQRNLPIGILASLVICTILYIVVALVFTGLISYSDLNKATPGQMAEPLLVALDHAKPEKGWPKLSIGGLKVDLKNWPQIFVAFGSVVAHTAVLLVFQLGQTRIFFSMSRDGLLPRMFQTVHPRYRTPWLSTILIGVIVGVLATVAKVDEMIDLTNIGTLFAFVLVCTGIIVLRVKDPNRPRPFRVPGGYLIPVLGVLSCFYLIYYLPPTSWLRFAAWLNFGFVVYVAYGAVHSRLTGRPTTGPTAEHDATTAYMGAWLGLGGAALLIGIRAIIIWFEGVNAARTYPFARALASQGLASPVGASSDIPQAAVALAIAGSDTSSLPWHTPIKAGFTWMFTAVPWLELSELLWFVIVPLAINAFILCPIVVVRTLRARRQRAGTPPRIAASLALSCGVAAATVVYFGLIMWYRLASTPG